MTGGGFWERRSWTSTLSAWSGGDTQIRRVFQQA